MASQRNHEEGADEQEALGGRDKDVAVGPRKNERDSEEQKCDVEQWLDQPLMDCHTGVRPVIEAWIASAETNSAVDAYCCQFESAAKY